MPKNEALKMIPLRVALARATSPFALKGRIVMMEQIDFYPTEGVSTQRPTGIYVKAGKIHVQRSPYNSDAFLISGIDDNVSSSVKGFSARPRKLYFAIQWPPPYAMKMNCNGLKFIVEDRD